MVRSTIFKKFSKGMFHDTGLHVEDDGDHGVPDFDTEGPDTTTPVQGRGSYEGLSIERQSFLVARPGVGDHGSD